ncbi:ATP-binding protein [Treponema pedis]|uniref:ATP-binding protein n=1 Tax=Treponema pedis TaxID=409322 RepID=UPI00197E2FB9|nr:ATP-binding protein [Treponema pedis]QSI04625.1 AAA family ATPase [Treponema pedis]
MDFNRKLPIGVQSFKDLREKEFLYVDKTAFIPKLANSGKVYFLSRPRRFGKSLFLSTLKAYFLGQKELFKQLAVEQYENATDEPWQEYPVFYFDFNVGEFNSKDDLKARLNFELSRYEEIYGGISDTPALRFQKLLERAYEKTGKQVVVLVDEYDKPLLQTMNVNETLNEEYRATLKAFYSVLKSVDQYVRFAFLTGVTKFSKVSIFSDLNNLRDISFEEDFSSVCGLTQTELEKIFEPEIKILQEKAACSYDEIVLQLKQKYDGYRFHQAGENVYNPFSVINAFAKKELGNYWFETGTPTFLVNSLKDCSYNIPDLDGHVEMDAAGLSDYRANSGSAIPILFQAGYLTIKDYDNTVRLYTLGFPNDEVRYGFLYNLLPSYSNVLYSDAAFSVAQFYRDIIAGRVNEFMQRLKSIMASVPYDTVKKESTESIALREHNFQICVYLVFALMGQFVKTETPSSTGRSDCTVETETAVYIFEFKLKDSAAAALQQIKKKNYAERYRAENKKIVLIGVSFNAEEKTVGEWIIEEA